MFEKFKDLEGRFRQVRMTAWLLVGSCLIISVASIYFSYQYASSFQNRIYVLASGKVMEALATDRRDNLEVEARDHIRTFHELFFSMEPDEKAISSGVGRALYLCDGSAKKIYDTMKESGFMSGIVAGNISLQVALDSIQLDMREYPYAFRFFGKESIMRISTVTVRNLVTRGWLRNTSRSENNPHGLLIERLEVLDNRDLYTKNR
jgi:conjugative transposon TraK protein